MGRRRGSSKRKKAKTAAAAGSTGDRITALPLELRARIVSLLSFRETVQLTAVSRPWRDIHHHTPVIDINLYDFQFFAVGGVYFHGHHSLLAARVALSRRARDASASRVETLRLAYAFADGRMRRHADRIIALADARDIRIESAHVDQLVEDAWALHLPPAARDLRVAAHRHLVPAITEAYPV